MDPSVLVFRPDAELFFANADSVVEAVFRAADESDPRPRAVVLDLESTDDLDIPAADALLRLVEQLAGEGIGLSLARVHPDALALLAAAGVVDAIGPDRVYSRVEDAVDAYREYALT